jgi:SAM-dependent methyltransferase
MHKVFTIRDLDAQREHMWSARRIEEEVAAVSRRAIAPQFLGWLPKDAPILEAGCGLGAWVVYLASEGYDIAGIDNDGEVIRRLKEWMPSLKVSKGDILDLPYEDGSVGAIISLGVMEHFEAGCHEALRETYRVLRPGGLLFFTVPLDNTFRKLFAHPVRRLYLRWRACRGDGIHFAEYRYTPWEVQQMLEENRFSVLVTTWDDFTEKRMSLGIWADFPVLQAKRLYELTAPGRVLAIVLNTLSRWIAAAGVLCIARKSRGG